MSDVVSAVTSGVQESAAARRAPRREVAGLRAAATVGVLVASWALMGCGAEAEESRTQAQQVAAGVLLAKPDGKPVSGVELELLVWPSPQSGAGATKVDDLVAVDSDTTGADGSFDLDAVAADLSSHASASGQVGLEIRQVGATGSGIRTTVRLTKVQETGVTMVEPVTELVVTLAGVNRGRRV